MQKQLVQVSNLDDFICRAESRIYVDGSTMILTPVYDSCALDGDQRCYFSGQAPQRTNFQTAPDLCPLGQI